MDPMNRKRAAPDDEDEDAVRLNNKSRRSAGATTATASAGAGAAAPIVQFYSKSKDSDDLGLGIPDWRKRLSNFWPCVIEVDGRRYPSIEHCFHAAKALCSSKPEIAVDWECGGSVGAA